MRKQIIRRKIMKTIISEIIKEAPVVSKMMQRAQKQNINKLAEVVFNTRYRSASDEYKSNGISNYEDKE